MQCIIFTQFTDPRLDGGPPIIEVPDAARRQIDIGYPRAIHVTTDGEERGFSFLVGNESSRHHELTGVRPTVGAVIELGHLPLLVDGFIS